MGKFPQSSFIGVCDWTFSFFIHSWVPTDNYTGVVLSSRTTGGWHLEKLGEYSGVVFVYSGAMLKPLHGTEAKDLRVALELCFMVYSLCRRFTAPVL